MAVRIGVVGVGFGTVVHVPAFQSEGLEVVAIMARRRERAEEAAARFSIPAVYDDFAALLAHPGLDAVSIVTPPALHGEMVLAALAAGKHVLCEKPFARTAAEAATMLAAANRTDRTAMVAHEFRFASARMAAKERLEQGYVGRPTLVLARLLRGPSTRPDPTPAPFVPQRDDADEGAGFLFQLGSHYIDGLRHLLGDVDWVEGTLLTTVPERVRDGAAVLATADDAFVFTLHFASGALAQMVASRAAPFANASSIEIYGTEGKLETPQQGFNPPPHGTLLGARLGGGELAPLSIPERFEPFVDERDDRLMPFRLLTREFVRGIEEGTSPAPNFADGYRCQQVLDAVREASLTGRRVELDPSLPT